MLKNYENWGSFGHVSTTFHDFPRYLVSPNQDVATPSAMGSKIQNRVELSKCRLNVVPSKQMCATPVSLTKIAFAKKHTAARSSELIFFSVLKSGKNVGGLHLGLTFER